MFVFNFVYKMYDCCNHAWNENLKKKYIYDFQRRLISLKGRDKLYFKSYLYQKPLED